MTDALLVNNGHHEGAVTVSLEAGQGVQVGNEGWSPATERPYITGSRVSDSDSTFGNGS